MSQSSHQSPPNTDKDNENLPIKRVESYSNTLNFITKKHNVRLNLLTGLIELNGNPINDFDYSNLIYDASVFFNKNISKDIVSNILDKIAVNNTYHPFNDFVEALEEIRYREACFNTFLNCFETSMDINLLRIYLKRWMLGLFDMHIHNKMTKNVLLVSGKQNACKTSLVKNILPTSLNIYGKVIDFDANHLKDSKVALCSLLVACFDEFEPILQNIRSRSDFKNLTSTYDIFERKSHRRNHEQMFRSSIIMATTNEKQILTDSTGNSRFLTIDMQGFNLKKYHKINMMNVWRVIYQYHKKGETSSLTNDERKLQDEENKEFETDDFELELIRKYFTPCNNTFYTTSDIKLILDKVSKSQLSLNLIGRALRKLGYKPKSKNGAKQYNIKEVG